MFECAVYSAENPLPDFPWLLAPIAAPFPGALVKSPSRHAPALLSVSALVSEWHLPLSGVTGLLPSPMLQ